MTRTKERKPAPAKSVVRCAIYTRKSTEEGLDQEFNSLDCAAGVRLGAARAILEIGLKLREIVDLEARVAAVEARQGMDITADPLPPATAA